jgi:hypothetical protein
MAWGPERFYVTDYIAAQARKDDFGFLKTRGFFCVRISSLTSECPMVVGRTIVYRDFDHITKPYALQVAGAFRAAFRKALVTLPATKRGTR